MDRHPIQHLKKRKSQAHRRKSNLVGINKYQETPITAEDQTESLSGIKTTAKGTSRVAVGDKQMVTTTKRWGSSNSTQRYG